MGDSLVPGEKSLSIKYIEEDDVTLVTMKWEHTTDDKIHLKEDFLKNFLEDLDKLLRELYGAKFVALRQSKAADKIQLVEDPKKPYDTVTYSGGKPVDDFPWSTQKGK